MHVRQHLARALQERFTLNTCDTLGLQSSTTTLFIGLLSCIIYDKRVNKKEAILSPGLLNL